MKGAARPDENFIRYVNKGFTPAEHDIARAMLSQGIRDRMEILLKEKNGAKENG